ncbi:hypothetical protein SY89_01882 [Halolamina pelagica]|uniref:DUF4157 domain-containing protein n=1 Tax=Halolamina pelagica TaxID=699431 RepID=A0A0N8I027_9EURY|nr:hypothetical protein [Halolamina pelagica]KPN31139.1 hypothetical protein SY89_01882 [Halolamina pelagica]
MYGDLPVNATLVWQRVESILGGEYDPPAVSVRDGALEPQTDDFAAHLGLGDGVETFDADRVRASYSQRTGRVRISPGNGSVAQVTRILAHEYVHVVQFRRVDGNRTVFLDRVSDRESFGIQRALIEGSAVYLEDAYTRQFLGFSAIERRCGEYRNGTHYERYAGQAYCFGGQYFAAQLDSPGEAFSPNTRLPNTTEQLLHPGTTEPPANLTVVDETPTDWYTPASFARRGELFARTVLGTELPEDRAAEAAAGWGNDRLVAVTGDTEGYVWVLRWDTDADAREFERAFADYLDARGNRTAEGWRVDGEYYRLATVDDRTVAVVTGNETFVDAVSVGGAGEKVAVAAA